MDRTLQRLAPPRVSRGRLSNVAVPAILFLNAFYSLFILMSPTLDFCMLSSAWLIGSIAYWAGVYFIRRRRGASPTLMDLLYLLGGQFGCVAYAHYGFLFMSQYA